MDVAYLRLLLDYHYWARDRLLAALDPLTPEQFTRDLGSSFRSIRDTVAHLHAAEWAWYSRWQGQSPTALLPKDRFGDVASARDLVSEPPNVLYPEKYAKRLKKLEEHGLEVEVLGEKPWCAIRYSFMVPSLGTLATCATGAGAVVAAGALASSPGACGLLR